MQIAHISSKNDHQLLSTTIFCHIFFILHSSPPGASTHFAGSRALNAVSSPSPKISWKCWRIFGDSFRGRWDPKFEHVWGILRTCFGPKRTLNGYLPPQNSRNGAMGPLLIGVTGDTSPLLVELWAPTSTWFLGPPCTPRNFRKPRKVGPRIYRKPLGLKNQLSQKGRIKSLHVWGNLAVTFPETKPASWNPWKWRKLERWNFPLGFRPIFRENSLFVSGSVVFGEYI